MDSRIPGLGILGLGLMIAACGDGITPPAIPPSASAPVAQLDEIPAEVHGRMTGGGHIRTETWDIGFAGVVRGLASEWTYIAWADADRWTTYEPSGEWVMQFHRLPDPALTGKTFKSTGFLDASFARKRAPTPMCDSRATFTVEGTLDGDPGWIAWVVLADAGNRSQPGARDSFRMALWPPGGHPVPEEKVLDTSDVFPADASCMGGMKRDLSAGNVRVSIGW